MVTLIMIDIIQSYKLLWVLYSYISIYAVRHDMTVYEKLHVEVIQKCQKQHNNAPAIKMNN